MEFKSCIQKIIENLFNVLNKENHNNEFYYESYDKNNYLISKLKRDFSITEKDILLYISEELRSTYQIDIEYENLKLLFLNQVEISDNYQNIILNNIKNSIKNDSYDLNILYQPIFLNYKNNFEIKEFNDYLDFRDQVISKIITGIIGQAIEENILSVQVNSFNEITNYLNNNSVSKSIFIKEDNYFRFNNINTYDPLLLFSNKNNSLSNMNITFYLNNNSAINVNKNFLLYNGLNTYLNNWFSEEINDLLKLEDNLKIEKIKTFINSILIGFHSEEDFKKAFVFNDYDKINMNNKDISNAIFGALENINFFIKPMVMELKKQKNIKYDMIMDIEENFSLDHSYVYYFKKDDFKPLKYQKIKLNIYNFFETLDYKDLKKISEEKINIINLFSINGHLIDGFNGIFIATEELNRILKEDLLLRFNNSTINKYNCIDNYIFTKNLDNTISEYINYFFLEEHKLKSKDINLLNILSNFEYQLLYQIKDKYKETLCHPQQALNFFLKKYNIDKEINIQYFIENIKIKNQKNYENFSNVYQILSTIERDVNNAYIQKQLKQLQEATKNNKNSINNN